jgi:hypothetical protein
MPTPLDLSDTSVRAYQKGTGLISLHLLSYLLVKTDITFSLSHYMRDISCLLILPDGTEIDFDNISYSHCAFFEFAFDTMAHRFKASTITDLTSIKPSLALLRVNYNISFTGHHYEEAESFEKVVPIIRRYH